MNNYPYVISSFPDLLLDFERHPLDPAAVIREVKSQLSDKDAQLVNWLEYGMDGRHLSRHFYRSIRQSHNDFLTAWFEFDRKMRISKVAFLDGQPFPEEFPELEKAEIIFKVDDLFQREKLLDNLSWNKAAELVEFDVLDLNIILSLLVRLHIVARWNRLDPSTGGQMFQQLVGEVRGTFKGINAEQL